MSMKHKETRDASENAYQHVPLDRRDSIRLLDLLPGAFHQPLRCVIYQLHKEHNVRYEALSYSWDAPVFPELILVGVEPAAQFLRITRNLATALKHLRYQDKLRTLWIDYLCIYQLDTEEKGHQVAHMG